VVELRTKLKVLLQWLVALATLSFSGLTARAQTLSPASLSFGNWVVQTTSSIETVTLSNTLTGSLTINSISVSGNFGQTSKCPVAPKTLAAGASCKISVTFTPTVLGTSTGTLTVNDSSSTSPQTVPLSGDGVYPAVLSPSSVAFAAQFLDTTSAVKTFTLQNYQTEPLNIAEISTSGDFAQTSNCPLSPNTLAAKLSCKISVSFTPTAVGARTGTLTVSDSASNSPQTAALSGTGTAPVSLSPATLAFASQVIGTTSTKKSVTLKNYQAVPLTISGIFTSGDFAQTSSTCPLSPNTLAAAASCTISVAFTPTNLGTRTGTLSVTDSASTSPQTVSLSGTGTLTGLVSISVAPANPTFSIGNQQQFVATGAFSGGVQVNITSFVTWSSSAPAVASVSSTGLAQAIAQGVASITASYGSVSGMTTVSVTPPTLTSIAIIPANPSVPAGAYVQFTAVLSYSDGSTKDTTTSVSWSSSATTVASINSSGVASALAAGSTTITASAESVSGSTTLTVSQPQCVTPPPGLIGWWTGDGNTVDIAGNNSGTLQNGATYSNGEVGQAFSFAGNGASVLVNSPVYSPSAGTLMFWFMPTGAGSLSGSYDGTNRTPGLSVDSSGNLDWEFGNLSAQGLGQVSMNQWSHVALTYSTSNSEVTVSVYLNGNLAASAIASPLTSWYPQVALGAYLGGQQPSFTGSMDEIAIFNQALTSQQVQQIYNASSGGMCKPTLQAITVNPANPSIAPGISLQFSAAGTYSDTATHDLTSSATWSSSNLGAATVNGSGQVTAVAIGSATIAAALGAQTGSTNLNVVPSLVSIQVNPQNPTIVAGTTQSFTATGTFSDGSTQDLTASVSWNSSLLSVATIAAGGLANGIAAGQAAITATAGSVSSFTLLTVTPATTAILTSIAVNPVNPFVFVPGTQQFTATGTYSDSSTQDLTNAATWTSSSTSVASVSSTGLVSALTAGTSTISATYQSVIGSTTLTVALSSPVLQSISVTPANSSVAMGQNQQFVATGQYSDGSTQNLTSSVNWSSSQLSVAGITTAGLASGLSGGSSSITASLGTISAAATLNVNSIALVAMAVTPGNVSVAPGTNQQFAAIATYADGSTLDLTTSAAWSSSLPSVVAVNATGLAASAATGQTTITATAAGIGGSSTLTVTSAALVSIAITPAVPNISLGTTEQFAATGAFTDGSVQNITSSVQWNSSNSSIATINNAAGSQGLATSVATGNSTISATSGSISASTTLTVSSTALASITVNPPIPSIAQGTTQQFTATGTFTDGSTEDLTTSATWRSGNAAVATVISTAQATSVAIGTALITATLGGVSGSTLLTVTPASVVSIAVNPATAAIPLGLNQAFTALGTFSDGSTQDVTDSAHWSSSVPGVATVSNTPGSNGVATSSGSGATVLSATLGGVAGSGSLTVTTALLATIEITPQSPSTPIGGTEQFTATGLYTDGSTPNITTTATWASSSATVATISNASGSQGLATSAGSGTAEISASVGSLTASTTLTVQDQLVSISVTPASSVITPGAVQQFTAMGTYLSGLVQNLTNSALWSSSNPAVATITAGGTVLSIASGQTVITASVGSVSGSSTLAVTPIQHVVIIFQENRTPDNLFQDPVLISNGADIQDFGVNSKGQTIPLSQIDLGTAGSNPDNYDLSHAHSAFVAMCDLNTSTGVCAMNGADHITVSCSPGVSNCAPANPQFMYVKPSDVQPYFQIAEQYTFGDRMFQTNQGPSFPAHQFIISGTSAPTASSNSYAAENPVLNGVAATVAGCIAPPAEIVSMINPAGNESSSMYPCFEHQTLTDLLEAANITWRYYAPTAGSIWTAPNAIQHMCGPNVAPPNATECTGSDWTNNVVISTTQNPAQVLTDIANGRLASVSWVIPSGLASDHARSNDGGGPSWVASVVNAIGSSPYWSNTAIIITWDDWGGWYDHVAPPILNSYEYGFRVPLIVVSPYAKQAYVSHVTHDFGSILKFIEGTFNLPSLGYADVPADDLSDCFNFTQTPTPFQTIAAPLNADYFLNDKRPPADPDDD
jgi:phospholipase C